MTAELSSAQSQPSLRHAWYVVGVLMLVYVFSFVDRQVFSLLVDPLRRDLDISDTQVSLLMGFSFALFYTCFGIPIGRLADTYSRRGIIAIGLLLWSLLTAACGLAGSYSQMLFLRMGVGVGEAALSPAAYSLITDLFPREKLASAISLYSMGIYIGMGLAYLLGGLVVGYAATHAAWDLPLVGPIRPWQLIFFFIGLPGLALLPLLATVREPPRQRKSAAPMREVLSYVFANRRTVLLHNVGFGFMSLSAYATFAWVPEFYRRAFQWDIRTTGLVYGVIVLLFGSLGITGAGRLVDRPLRPRARERRPVRRGRHRDPVDTFQRPFLPGALRDLGDPLARARDAPRGGSLRDRPNRHPADHASHHARPGFGGLSVRVGLDRSRHRAHRGRHCHPVRFWA